MRKDLGLVKGVSRLLLNLDGLGLSDGIICCVEHQGNTNILILRLWCNSLLLSGNSEFFNSISDILQRLPLLHSIISNELVRIRSSPCGSLQVLWQAPVIRIRRISVVPFEVDESLVCGYLNFVSCLFDLLALSPSIPAHTTAYRKMIKRMFTLDQW